MIPDTQAKAWASIQKTLGASQFKVWEYLWSNPYKTRNEIDRALGEGRPNATFSRRLAEMARMGIVGRRHSRACAITQRTCETWVAVDAEPVRISGAPKQRAKELAFNRITELLDANRENDSPVVLRWVRNIVAEARASR